MAHRHKPRTLAQERRQAVFESTQADCLKVYKEHILASIKGQRAFGDGLSLVTPSPFSDPSSPTPPPSSASMEVKVVWGDSFEVARTMGEEIEGVPCVLNMASDKKPGGGVVWGASAQEEELCRCSTLYPALASKKELYPWPSPGSAFFTPGVVVFRAPGEEDYGYLHEPHFVNVVSAAAMRNPVWVKGGYGPKDFDHMRKRIRAMLKVCVETGQRNLVLGAWGCGAFRNPPKGVALAFRSVLLGEFSGYFDRVWFAILGGERTNNFEIFSRILGYK